MNGPAFGRPRSLLIAIVLLLWVLVPAATATAHSPRHQASADPLTPANTVIIANATDAQFSQDFSPLLKKVRLPWIIVDNAVVPDALKEKHLILLGRLGAPHADAIMRQLLTVEEMEALHATPDEPIVLRKDSPWSAGRVVTICTGASLLLTRNAAEQAVRTLIANAPPASAWIQTTFDAPLDAETRAYAKQLRFTWDDQELPLADLLVDVGAKPRWRVSASQAAADVKHLFSLFAHGYAGYAFFNQQGEFARAKARILEQLSTRTTWSTDAFARLLHAQLRFITDCHLTIGDQRFAGHADFWYETTLGVTLERGGYAFTVDGDTYKLLAVNGEDPEPFLFPSLNAQGAPVYRLGALADEPPAPLLLLARSGEHERHFEISLRRSDFDYYTDDIFREDDLGGLPIVRVRSFGDVWTEALNQFVETGRRYRGEPVVIVDIRGNGGGNEAWPIAWIQGLTGRRAESIFIFSELQSKTTMAGRANVFASLAESYPDISSFGADARRYTSIAEAFENGTRQPTWSGPRYPQVPLIENDTTLIIISNRLVASAGEGLIMRASQAENVVLVGENSMGCLTFGNAGTHQLPHSRLTLQLPINFGLFLDGQVREGKGLMPDLWVPAADAVNYAVAAVRSGTITTRSPLSPATLQQPFVPEDPWARVRHERIILAVVITLLTAAGSVWAYFMRRRPRIVASLGAVWIAIGSVWSFMERPIGFAFLTTGAICLLWGLTNLLRARHAPEETAA